MRDLLARVLHERRQQTEDEAATTTLEAAAIGEVVDTSPVPTSTVSPSLPGTPQIVSAASSTSTQASSTSEVLLPSQVNRMSYVDLPSFLSSMVDFNGQRLFRFAHEDQRVDIGSGDSSGGVSAASDGMQQSALAHSLHTPDEHSDNHRQGSGGDWNQFPSHMDFSYDIDGDNREQQFSAFRPLHLRGRFNRQLHHQRQQHHLNAASSVALAALGGPFGMMSRPPSGPPQEIDLTVSSSESENEDSEHGFGGGENEEEEDDDVEIVHTRTTNVTAAPPSGVMNPSTQYLTYTSIPPLRRKRRRQENDDGSAAAADDPVSTEMFDGQRAESTNISMENNEVIERFKKSIKCSICLDAIEEMTSTICGHVYCGKCIRLAIRVTGKCPLCQRKLRPKDIHPLYF